MTATATRAAPGALRQLPTTARPVVDPADVEAPPGYEVEGGRTRPTRPYVPALVLRFDPNSSAVHTIGTELPGYALGDKEPADTAFRIVAEKWKDQLLIQELVPEMGPQSIRYHEDA